MKLREGVLSLLIIMILGTSAIAITQPLRMVDNEIPIEYPSKLGRSLISSIEESQSDSVLIDILVACDKNLEPEYITKASKFVQEMVITKTWPILGGFRANVTPRDILRLAELPYVTRIDMNSKGHACMDTARQSTHINWLIQYDPTMDGDKDGMPTSYSKDDIVIAILDTGIDIGHQDLDEDKVIGWVDIAGDWEGHKWFQPYDDHYVDDEHQGHGTHCASIAAGSGDENPAFHGVARYAALVGVKMMDFTGTYELAWAIEAFSWVAQNRYKYGIEIVSCSWGSSNPDTLGEYTIVSMFADWLVESCGLVVCIAAGNSGDAENTITPPGTAKYAITVGMASDRAGGGWSLHEASSRGLCDDGSIKPDILAPGDRIVAAQRDTTNLYFALSGTSMATPFVAGLAALWLDKDYSLRWAISDYHPHPRVKKLLMASATDMPDDSQPGVDRHYGAGRIDAQEEYLFYTTDISTSSSDAPTALGYSWNIHEYTHFNEPLWVHDPGQDYFKLYCYSSLFMIVYAHGDPDLVLRIKLFDRYMSLLSQSSASNYAYIGYFAQYSGAYYIQIVAEQYSGDYYDITIMTTPS